MYRFLLAASLLVVSSAAMADDISDLGQLRQNQFHGLSADLAAAVQFRQLAPAEPEGVLGFDIGIGISGTQVAHERAWQMATGDDVSTLPMARLRFTKGLPGNVDIGAYYSAAPNSNIKAYGLELRYAILEGSAVMPAIGLRATYNKIDGVDHLDFHTASLGASISKGFGPVTPYLGVSHIWVSSTPTFGPSSMGSSLDKASFGKNKVFVGLQASLAIVNIAVEADRMDDNTTYAIKFAVGL